MQGNVLVRYGWKTALAASVLCAGAIVASAQTFTTLATFTQADGSGVEAPLVEGLDGNFYGTATGGGPTDNGTFFRLTPQGVLTPLHSFCVGSNCTDGTWPQGPLVEGAYGSFYGTATRGGPFSGGTIFRITADGALTTLYSFPCALFYCDPYDATGLIRGTNGNFYGMTQLGGANGYGMVFQTTPAGKETTLYNFCSQTSCADGQEPLGSLVQGADGYLYGTTGLGGTKSDGTFFKITAGGKLTTLYNFCSLANCADGRLPLGAPVLGPDGNFYGVTYYGGGLFGPGTIYKITPGGILTNLYTFCALSNCGDGRGPNTRLVLATGGNFYGTTEAGGAHSGCGTIFRVTPLGKLTTLHTFPCYSEPEPPGWLIQGTDGDFYGTISGSGTGGYYGAVFRLSEGLKPFVKTVYTSGRVGSKVQIVGRDLRWATAVRFNGMPAKFKILTRYEITTAVPIGATTGTVTLTTPRGKLASNIAFTVLP